MVTSTESPKKLGQIGFGFLVENMLSHVEPVFVVIWQLDSGSLEAKNCTNTFTDAHDAVAGLACDQVTAQGAPPRSLLYERGEKLVLPHALADSP